MKISYLNIILMSSAFLLIFSSCGNEKKEKSTNSENQTEEKITEVSPEVIFENDYAKVAKVSLAPGESQPAHEGENRVIYSLTDYSIDWKEKGKDLGTKTWKKGDAHFHEAGKHAATNNGTTTAEWLVFIKKSTDLPECGENKIENDVSSVSAEFVKVLLDNDEFKLAEVTLPKGASIPMHSGINRIIYSLTDFQIMYESNKDGKIEKTFKTGDIHWHEACMHSLENLGQTEAKYLVVSYKKK
jgi:quercetin dioxygenase-like cupin family protein